MGKAYVSILKINYFVAGALAETPVEVPAKAPATK